jgi:acetoin utilization deacetylase AcuC-like enzyme
MAKYRLLRERLLQLGLVSLDEVSPSPLATREELEQVHTARYLDACFQGTLTVQEQRRLGFPWSEALLTRSLASVGGTLAAARFRARGRPRRQPRGRHPPRVRRSRRGVLRLQRPRRHRARCKESDGSAGR